ncbi:MAG TPA: FliA/WhiG family RNA polymerase sigma factor [Candidatus Kapabacteria bacterium]|nr:FliA/WhiG family RNA polymerase sigma factor [Candidatus Kapabacteria bacterium]
MNNNTKEIEALWNEYRLTFDLTIKQQLIISYSWLVKYAINNMPIPVNSILEENDYLSVGMIALNDTIEKFDPSRGFKFETYAIQRIKGIIKDELRRVDFLSRGARKKAQDYQQTLEKFKKTNGDDISNEEIRKKLNVSPEKFKEYLEAVALAKSAISLNDASTSSITIEDETINIIEEIPDESSDFLQGIYENERRTMILEYIKKLKDNQRIILTLYYFENLTFKEIGKVLNVSESRISQLHTQLLAELKSKLSELQYA